MSGDFASGHNGRLVSVVVVDYNAGPALAECLASLRALTGVDVEIVVVRNGSSPPVESADSDVRWIVPAKNLGFAAGANVGIAATQREWLALVNPDTVLPSDGLDRLTAFLAARPAAAAVSPILRWPDGTAQPYWFGDEPSPSVLLRRALRRLTGHLPTWEVRSPRPVDWVSGACLVARRSAIDAVGPLDERFFLYFEDADWCRRSRNAGWQIWIEPAVSVVHRSCPDYRDVVRRRLYQESLRTYIRKYYGRIASLALAVALAASAPFVDGRP